MPDMSWQSNGYRYGYNGMEMDNDIKGTGNHLSTHFRGLDPRVVRWGSPDPLESKFPDRSTYVSMGNNPINRVDPFGDSTYLYGDNKFRIAEDLQTESPNLNISMSIDKNGAGKIDASIRNDIHYSDLSKKEQSIYDAKH